MQDQVKAFAKKGIKAIEFLQKFQEEIITLFDNLNLGI